MIHDSFMRDKSRQKHVLIDYLIVIVKFSSTLTCHHVFDRLYDSIDASVLESILLEK